MQAAYYHAPIEAFLETDDASILGALVQHHGFALEHQQRDAWLRQISLLKPVLAGLARGHILFEFAIPRMGKRADVILLVEGIVFLLEFKVGARNFDRSAIEQVHDYALDMKNFHKGSHDLPIVPVVLATEAATAEPSEVRFASDNVAEPVLARIEHLPALIARCTSLTALEPINLQDWLHSGYQPTPTIVEAAQALYQNHAVEEIARSDASAQNLSHTTDCISAIIDRSKAEGRKAICFVTGVPGAGKTLAGLNIATKRAQEHSDEHAVFLSGNGPLVIVLREALARDEAARAETTKTNAHRKVSSFIQNIHHFRDEALNNTGAPHEKVAVFDEAQRAWTRDQASRFMQIKRGHLRFDMSEPEFLISVMDRHEDWCVVVCLIGGGQEINTGEAGLGEWLSALNQRFRDWDIYISDRLEDGDYVTDETSTQLLGRLPINRSSALHLSVSMRSFRAEALSSFIGHIVDNRPGAAREVFGQVEERYPIWLTRDLDAARAWLRSVARGSERFGLVASSGAYRLRPEGLHVKAKVDAATWFLNDRTDVRSSFYLEEVATEFDVQGLELDWVGVCWDADFRHQGDDWGFFNFRGTAWQRVNQEERQLHLKNAYRVILTRARQGMIIFVPEGDASDPTRPPSYYDKTYAFLKACGLNQLAAGNLDSEHRWALPQRCG
ncbi:DUF2075 domain-containing protein [Cereibacter sphaeroides]|uniref:DUF2075 domain-containing protein n=1 Tax=Cereibacter sphaeroides TaxID=1063 RepID=UPI001F37DB76|nr:DUF2075 domain-containing protein [Cereibacter sphaeroides]MCE6967615.1 DUF2075 domain-containing protein [Cereibacter sphaeroides]